MDVRWSRMLANDDLLYWSGRVYGLSKALIGKECFIPYYSVLDEGPAVVSCSFKVINCLYLSEVSPESILETCKSARCAPFIVMNH